MDGRPDLFVVNGMVTGKNETEREIDFWNLMSAEFKKFEKGIPIAEFGDDSLWGRPPKRFYRNRDGRHFDELAAVTGLESNANQRGLVVLDANGDGAPDLFAAGFLQPQRRSGSTGTPRTRRRSSSRSKATPPRPGPHRSTRDALGATVTVESGGLSRTQVVSAGYSFLSSGAEGALLRPRRAARSPTASRCAGLRAASPRGATCRRAPCGCASRKAGPDAVRTAGTSPRAVGPVGPALGAGPTAVNQLQDTLGPEHPATLCTRRIADGAAR